MLKNGFKTIDINLGRAFIHKLTCFIWSCYNQSLYQCDKKDASITNNVIHNYISDIN